MRCGASPSLLLHELRELGELSARAILDAVPPLSEIDPERCYVWWEMDLITAAGREAIRDVFIFVEDASELSIAAAGDPAPAVTLTSPASDQRRRRGLSKVAAALRLAAAATTSRTRLRVCACRRPSWISSWTWSESW